MPNISSSQLRNIVLMSHSGAGKTMLAEAMLYDSGVTSRMGTIEDGTTTSDYEMEEIRRQTSVQTSVVSYNWKNHKINVIDTPGYADFRGQAISGFRVADGAVIVIAAPSGLEVGTHQMWKMAEARKMPRIVFISKMDRENADFERVMSSIKETFGRQCVPLNMPIGAETSFSGIIDLLNSDTESSEATNEIINKAREQLTEAIAETDDNLATKYLEGESISIEELKSGLKEGVANGTIVPVLVGSSTMNIGTKELMDAITDYMPSPEGIDPTTNISDGNSPIECDPSGPLSALIFNTTADPFVGKLSYFRVYSGTFQGDSQIWNINKKETERVSQLYEVCGKTQNPIKNLVAGDIGAISKMSSVLTGHTLCTKETPIEIAGIEFPAAVYHRAVYPSSKADADKMTSSLARISEEDPSLQIIRDPDTLEVILCGLGDTHIEVTVEKIKRKFGIDVKLQAPKIPYKETIINTTKVEYRHKKQSGGSGQYAHVWLELSPLPRGTGFEFASAVVGGVVPREYIPAVEKGVGKALTDGVLAGFPVVDLRVTLVDGGYHPVDSSGIAFEIAGGHALSKGIEQANPVLLEPVMVASITVPETFTGDVMGDLNSKRGRIQGITPIGTNTTSIEVEVPQAEMLQYATELRSQTQGQGSFTMEVHHYEEVPQHLIERLVEKLNTEKDQ